MLLTVCEDHYCISKLERYAGTKQDGRKIADMENHNWNQKKWLASTTLVIFHSHTRGNNNFLDSASYIYIYSSGPFRDVKDQTCISPELKVSFTLHAPDTIATYTNMKMCVHNFTQRKRITRDVSVWTHATQIHIFTCAEAHTETKTQTGYKNPQSQESAQKLSSIIPLPQ